MKIYGSKLLKKIRERLYSAVNLDGKTYRVKITVKEDVTSSAPFKAHSYEATEIELQAGTLGNSETGLSPETNNSIYAANLLQGIESVNNPGTLLLENHSKVVDKNGEPQVVYHGTPHFGFSVFDDRKTYFGIFFSTKARVLSRRRYRPSGSYQTR